MAKREILVLNKAASAGQRIQAAQSGDTYLLPRLCYSTTGEFTSEVTAGASARAFTFNSGSTFGGTAGAKIFSVQDNGTDILSVANSTTGPVTTIIGKDSAAGNKLVIQPGTSTTAGTVSFSDYLGLGVATLMESPAANAFAFNSYTSDSVSAKTALGFNNAVNLTNSGSKIASFTNGTTGFYVRFGYQGSVEASRGLGLYGATANINTQYSTTGTSAGFTAGGGTTVTHTSTFTGNSGTKAYTISDIVLCLKNSGLMAAS